MSDYDKFENVPNDNYKKFFAKFKEIETLPIKEWKPTHLIGYFCKKYFEYYKIPYQFKFNTPTTSKCFEVFQMKRLGSTLTTDPELLKVYIDYIFLTKVKNSKRKLTSISFLTTETDVVDYKMNILLADQKPVIDRNTILPDKYKLIFKEEAGLDLSTYADLAFLSQSDMPLEVIGAFIKLEGVGFNKDILEKIL